MVSALQYCFWVEGAFTFSVYVWGAFYFWWNPTEPVWGALKYRRFFIPWLLCELAGIPCFGIITAELWDKEAADWHVLLIYSVFLIGEAMWMILTVYQQVEWTRICLYTVTASVLGLAIEIGVENSSSRALPPAILLAAHIGIWDAVIWMNSWEEEVEAYHTPGGHV